MRKDIPSVTLRQYEPETYVQKNYLIVVAFLSNFTPLVLKKLLYNFFQVGTVISIWKHILTFSKSHFFKLHILHPYTVPKPNIFISYSQFDYTYFKGNLFKYSYLFLVLVHDSKCVNITEDGNSFRQSYLTINSNSLVSIEIPKTFFTSSLILLCIMFVYRWNLSKEYSIMFIFFVCLTNIYWTWLWVWHFSQC